VRGWRRTTGEREEMRRARERERERERKREKERESAARPREDAVRGRAVELSGSLPWAPRARERESERKATVRSKGEGEGTKGRTKRGLAVGPGTKTHS
jgi:hypothetical protein